METGSPTASMVAEEHDQNESAPHPRTASLEDPAPSRPASMIDATDMDTTPDLLSTRVRNSSALQLQDAGWLPLVPPGCTHGLCPPGFFLFKDCYTASQAVAQ